MCYVKLICVFEKCYDNLATYCSRDHPVQLTNQYDYQNKNRTFELIIYSVRIKSQSCSFVQCRCVTKAEVIFALWSQGGIFRCSVMQKMIKSLWDCKTLLLNTKSNIDIMKKREAIEIKRFSLCMDKWKHMPSIIFSHTRTHTKAQITTSWHCIIWIFYLLVSTLGVCFIP